MSNKKLRPVYMTDEAYYDARAKAFDLDLTFSSYMGMLAKKDKKEGVKLHNERHLDELIMGGDETPNKPVGLMHHVERGRSADPTDKKRALTESIAKWASERRLGINSDQVRIIVNKILEETK